jgi:transposase
VEDESHLLWGDTVGYVWGNRNESTEIPIKNERERQTYCGAIDFYSREFLVRAYDRADSAGTVSFLKYLRNKRKNSKILIIWDMAGYHRYAEMKKYSEEISRGHDEKDRKITCIFFEPDAPEQNPVEDIWLKGKNFLRKHFYENKTSAQVKKCFFNFLNGQFFNFDKLKWYVTQFI